VDGQLEIIDGPDAGRAIPFADGQTLLIGRGPNTASKLSDKYTSRSHCQIEVQEGVLTLSDLGGAGGTSVNGALITGKHVLAPGDVIGIGMTKLRVHGSPTDTERTIRKAPAVSVPPNLVPAPPSPTVPPAPALPEDASLLSGLTLADYKVGPVLAYGSTAVVYKAATVADNQTVALKVFHAGFGHNDEAKKRFLRCARTVLNLRHPHIIRIDQAGETGNFCWMAMEFFEGGESLAKVIQRIGIANILDWRYGLRIAVHVARGLEFAQKHKIVHRNITPGSVLYRGSDRFAKLGDLMLAKTLTEEDAGRVTSKGSLVGDIEYMSPERLFGEAEIDGRSDLYELGATVYALLTGKPPITGKSPKEGIESFQKNQPIPPKRVQLSIPDRFEAIVLQMLARKPADRFQTPADLLAALEKVAKMEGVVT
jgi:serine/threonine protein kinase